MPIKYIVSLILFLGAGLNHCSYRTSKHNDSQKLPLIRQRSAQFSTGASAQVSRPDSPRPQSQPINSKQSSIMPRAQAHTAINNSALLLLRKRKEAITALNRCTECNGNIKDSERRYTQYFNHILDGHQSLLAGCSLQLKARCKSCGKYIIGDKSMRLPELLATHLCHNPKCQSCFCTKRSTSLWDALNLFFYPASPENLQ